MRYMFYVIGVGGTGSLLARDLAKLLIRKNSKMCLVDNDIVERKNILRQGYQEQDVGDNKALALSRKINSLYDIDCFFIDEYANEVNLLNHIKNHKRYTPVLVGCVDNDATRKMLEKVVNELDKVVYVDSANSEWEGNIYVYTKYFSRISGKMRGQCYKLEDDHHPAELSCQDQAATGNVQYLVTNAKMAVSLLEHCTEILNNEAKGGVQVVRRFETVFYE